MQSSRRTGPVRSFTTFLPFLYNTATIRRIYSHSNSSPSSLGSLRDGCRHSLERSQSRQSLKIFQSASFSNCTKFYRDSDYIPFEGQENLEDTSVDSLSKSSGRSTLTDEEEKAFSSLLEKAQEASEQTDDIQELREASTKAVLSDHKDSSSQNSAISILQGALATAAREKKEKGKSTLLETLPPPLRTLLKAKRSSQITPEDSTQHQRPYEDEHIVNRAQDIEFKRVDKLFARAKTDVELWSILEKHVFARVHALNHDTSASNTSGSNPTQATTQAQLKSTAAHADKLKPSQLTRRRPADAHHRDKQRQRDAALAILGPNYSAWLVRATRMLRHDFPGSSLALSILPKVKALGVASYAMGASTTLYNELIALHWAAHADWDGVAALLREMESGGLDFDAATLELLEGIGRQLARARKGAEGRVMWLLVRMDGNVRRARMMAAWRVRVRQRLEADALKAAEKVTERAEAERERERTEREEEEEVLKVKEGDGRGEEGRRMIAGAV